VYLLRGSAGASPSRCLHRKKTTLKILHGVAFGGGHRVCIGNTFALMEAAIVLAAVGQKYRFTLNKDAKIDVNPMITLLPAHGIPTKLVTRHEYAHSMCRQPNAATEFLFL
jgi:cytochrome P450